MLPHEAADVRLPRAPAVPAPTCRRGTALLWDAILTPGRRTVAHRLRTLGTLADGHPPSSQRVRAAAAWSARYRARRRTRRLGRLLPADRPLVLVGDDRVDGPKGPKVHGKARQRDPVRSSHAYTAGRYGHQGVVRAVLVGFPCAQRPWAVPVLVDLYRCEQDNRQRQRRHRTPAQLMCRRRRRRRRGFPDRCCVFVGEAGYGTPEGARCCRRHRQRLTLVSPLHPDANLFAPPPGYAGTGRPRVKGTALPTPRQAAAVAALA